MNASGVFHGPNIRIRISFHKEEELSGFRKCLGTRGALFSIKILLQRAYKYRKDVFVCFIDYQEAYDAMIRLLQELGMDNKDIRIIKNLHWGLTAEIHPHWKRYNRGIPGAKGCAPGVHIFSNAVQPIFGKRVPHCFGKSKTGIKVNEKPINNLRYADNTAIIAGTIED